jgi:hypothetical protein
MLFAFGCKGSKAHNQDPPPCEPRCEGKVCGVDGCGGLCGTCTPGQRCDFDGRCVLSCSPDCTGRECGPDGCGGSCGGCTGATPDCNVMTGMCFLCVPDCTNANCGDDGCGGSCGTCTSTTAPICFNRACCSPNCDGAECGTDFCGGSCGICTIDGEICDNMTRQCEPCDPMCTGRECGFDGCDGTCGDCDPGEVCDPDGQCCVPNCTGRVCGSDGCGGTCGPCMMGTRCNDAAGQCEACTPECTDRECGDDDCNGSCGTCAGGLFCLDSGRCSCAPACTPSCDDRMCGPDDCGGSCGECAGNTACNFDPGRMPGWRCDPFPAASAMMSFFVTSEGNMMNGGDLGGLAAADAKCRSLAEAAGVTGKTWRAYLSVSAMGIAARDRIGAGPWFNAYGDRIVDAACNTGGRTCLEALHEDQIAAELVVTENGEQLEWGSEHDILTGTSTSGTPSGADCRAWTSSAATDFVTVGHSDGQRGAAMDRSSWNAAHPTGCDFPSIVCQAGRGHTYCFAL